MNAWQWCMVVSLGLVIGMAFVRQEQNLRLVLGVLAAVALLVAVLIGSGVIATTG